MARPLIHSKIVERRDNTGYSSSVHGWASWSGGIQPGSEGRVGDVKGQVSRVLYLISFQPMFPDICMYPMAGRTKEKSSFISRVKSNSVRKAFYTMISARFLRLQGATRSGLSIA